MLVGNSYQKAKREREREREKERKRERKRKRKSGLIQLSSGSDSKQ